MTDFAQGDPVWADLMTSDVAGARRFYGEVFGWTFEETPESFGGYVNVLKDGAVVAGLMGKEAGMEDIPDAWTVYLASDDAMTTTEAAHAAGGTVHMPVAEVGDLGRMALLLDSAGANLGVWESGTHRGFAAMGAPGTPGWFEVHTKDYAGAKDFYAKTFGVTLAPMMETPEFSYCTFGEGEDASAGILDAADALPAEAPSAWRIYWGVDDADAAIAAAERLGGRVTHPAEDSPYGRVAGLADPWGAEFRIVQAAPGETLQQAEEETVLEQPGEADAA